MGKVFDLENSKTEDVTVRCYEVLTLLSGDAGIEMLEYSPNRCK